MVDQIDPEKIPYVTCWDPWGTTWNAPADVTKLGSSAVTMKTLASSVRSGGQDTMDAWSKIVYCYSGPGDQTVWFALTTVGPDTDALATSLEAVADAVATFADDIDPVLISLATIKSQAEQLKTDIGNFQPHWSWGRHILSWDQDPGLVSRNTDLRHQVDDQVVKFENAERTCANTIDALYGGTQYHAWGATDGLPDPNSSYGYDEATLDGAAMPWGAPVERSESCEEKTVMFLPNMPAHIDLAAVGLVTGLGTLAANLVGVSWERGTTQPGEHGVNVLGYKITWSWQEAAQTAEGLGDTILGVAAAAAGPVSLFTGNIGIPTYDFTTGQRGSITGNQITTSMVKSMIAWDEWRKDPGSAMGEVVFNIGTLFIPGAGEAAAIGDATKGAEAAMDAMKAIDAATDAARIGEGADLAHFGAGAEATHLGGDISHLPHTDLPHTDLPHTDLPADARIHDPGATAHDPGATAHDPGATAHEPEAKPAHDNPAPAEHEPAAKPADHEPAAKPADHEPEAKPAHDNPAPADHEPAAKPADHEPATPAHDSATNGHPPDGASRPDVNAANHETGAPAQPGTGRTGDIVPSDGSSLAPGETHLTMRQFEITPPTGEDIAHLEALAAQPDSPIVKIGDSFYMKNPVEVRSFDADGYFASHGIDPNAIYADGRTYGEEYARQLQLQQDGINDLTVAEWQHNVAQFNNLADPLHGRIGATEQADARAAAGGTPGDGQAILHGPDQVAGGRPDTYDGLGSTNINSSIGSRWRSRVGNLELQVDGAAAGIPDGLARFVHMNVHLIP